MPKLYSCPHADQGKIRAPSRLSNRCLVLSQNREWRTPLSRSYPRFCNISSDLPSGPRLEPTNVSFCAWTPRIYKRSGKASYKDYSRLWNECIPDERDWSFLAHPTNTLAAVYQHARDPRKSLLELKHYLKGLYVRLPVPFSLCHTSVADRRHSQHFCSHIKQLLPLVHNRSRSPHAVEISFLHSTSQALLLFILSLFG
jgi:hypothetical protein